MVVIILPVSNFLASTVSSSLRCESAGLAGKDLGMPAGVRA